MSKRGSSTTRGHLTRARILKATRRLLLEQGASAFSLREVAVRAGLSLSNLQFHYRDQSTLLRALLADELTRGRQLVNAAFAGAEPSSLGNGLAVALGALLDQQRDNDTMKLYLALWSFAASDKAVREALRLFYDGYVNEIVDYLRSCEPRVDAAAARDRARVAVALLEGASLFRSGIAGVLAPRHERLIERTLLGLLAPAVTAADASRKRRGERR